ncbi:thioesterase II family protein [Bradyrhizobium sp.]|jgi:surfactin synthase thioesterase subunit|uniref:thioesterase II family protein n=1 Tax=Bradyrhizobium sp. TaxID=376 RepID=UPI002E07DA28|nr:alpha/beta fold hydrolase [Bradyrhizobium sp.]
MPMKKQPTRWFLSRPLPAAKAHLFCFPYAGSGASAFAGWQAQLGADIKVQALEMPGHGQRFGGRPETDIRRLVGEIVDAITPLLDRPVFFFGHSLGAVLAFEVLRELRSFPIRHLFASGCRAPCHLPSPQMRDIVARSERPFIELVHGYGGLPEEIVQDRDLQAVFLPILKADFTMIADYVYDRRDPLQVPITLLTGDRDTHVPEHVLAAWQNETVHKVSRQRFKGGHFFIADAQVDVVRFVGAAIRRQLARDHRPSTAPLA